MGLGGIQGEKTAEMSPPVLPILEFLAKMVVTKITIFQRLEPHLNLEPRGQYI